MRAFVPIKSTKEGAILNGSSLIEEPIMPFPVDVFPDVVKRYIEDCENSLNLIPDFMGVGVLSSVATLIGNSYSIQIKEGWTERPLFWMAIVGHSGIRKTPSLDAVIRPLQQMDKVLFAKYCEEMKDYEAQLEGNGFKKPSPQQLVVTDSTIEALIPILKHNANGILYFKDELLGWINDLGRYQKGSAEQQWLSLYSNQPICLNRKTDDLHIRVDNPFANVLGGIQPSLLSSLFEDGRSMNGFSSRIIFSFPDPIKRKVSLAKMDNLIAEAYDNFIARFSNLKNRMSSEEEVQPKLLQFSYAAQKRFYEWDETFVNKRINDPCVSDVLKSVLSKMEALMPRLALVMEFIDRVARLEKEPEEVDLDSVNKAIRLTEYFYAHFLKVHQKVNHKEIIHANRNLMLLKAFAANTLKGFSKEDCIKDLLVDGYTNAEISKALETPKTNVSFWAKK